MRIVLVFILISIIINCSSGVKRKKLLPSQAPELSQEEAIHRAEKISNIHYDLSFDFTQSSDEFIGQSKIEFDLSNDKEDLRIDFHGGEILNLVVNTKLRTPDYNKHFILLKPTELKPGRNSVIVQFKRPFSKDGSGLYKFVDPEDNRVYLYSDLEPFDANKVFPCFDQPNLKARYTMKVTTPHRWQVVTSVLEKNKIKTKENLVWIFPKSELFSTYIWSLHAGPYFIFTDKKAQYPSRVFVRQSMKKYVKIKDWFTFTRQGFEFFNDYFGYEYPYKKYDQLIVPDFNSGAMENVAAVTFSERYVSRGEKSQKLRRRLASVIFHEMAHMWFGNLVTMNWWDDLWLNESFATYLATLGLSRNTEFKDVAWRDFRGTKNWALWEDQLVTTHPIEATVPDTSQAFANFDGITYGKGASSLKQIHYAIGDEAFKNGIQRYFKTFAHKNTTLKDFMTSLSEAASRDLSYWQKKWLQTTGVNTISVSYKCRDDKTSEFEVLQKDHSGQNIMRPHSFKLALLDKRYRVFKTLKVEMNKDKKQIPQLNGLDCPTVVYPNFEDEDYMMVNLDKKSLENLEGNIEKVSDRFLRQLLWESLSSMVYYGRYDYLKYTSLVEKKLLGLEQDPEIVRNILQSIYGRGNNGSGVFYYLENDSKLPESEKSKIKLSYETKIFNIMESVKPKSELQKIYFLALLRIAHSEKGLETLHNILLGKKSYKGLTIDDDKKWSILYRLSTFAYPETLPLVATQLKNDPSSRGQNKAIGVKARYPEFKTKKAWIDEFLNKESSYSLTQFKHALYSLFPKEQTQLRDAYKTFFQDLLEVDKSRDTLYTKVFARLVKKDCSPQTIKELKSFIEDNKLSSPVEKSLKISLQENERCRDVLDNF